MTPPGDRRLGSGTLSVYAAPGVGVNFLYVWVLIMYMKFATDVLGAAPAVLGLIFLASKIWDAVSDPIAGFVSDRTRSRLGRRRSWMLASALPICFFSWMLWAPPRELEGSALALWIAVAVFGFYSAFTVFEVPHMAYGAELSQDAPERNRIYGWRQMARTLGMFAAAGVGVALLQNAATARANALWLALGVGGATSLCIVWAVGALPRERTEYAARGATQPLRALGDVWRNPHARLLLFVFFSEQIGTGAIGVLVPYVAEYVMKAPELTSPMLIVFMSSAALGIPLWVRLGDRFDKKPLWLTAMLLSASGFGLLVFVDEGRAGLMALASVIAGVGNACGATIGNSLQADVVDWDEAETGERKEGTYFAVWSFVGKLASGIMMGLVGLSLAASGFVPNAEQTVVTKRVMVFLMGGMPLLGFALGAALFTRFRLDASAHARVLARLGETPPKPR